MQRKSRAPRWESILSSSVTTADQLPDHWPVASSEIRQVVDTYPMKINPYYLSLIRTPGDPMGKQVIPSTAELRDQPESDDPLMEENQSPIPNLIHRYPDRVVLLASDRCPVHCRFCLRKRKIGREEPVGSETLAAGIDYIGRHRQIREVILSGGDPLLLSTRKLHSLLSDIRRVPSVELVRIHSRVPCALPERITENLTRMLRTFHPLYINTHFNHPDEVTPRASAACHRLTDAGIPVGCQTVLLRGINDDPKTMGQLMARLLQIRVRPYYIHQMDPIRGACHFSASLDRGLDILRSLRGYTSGMAVPQYMIDLPGGGGKVPLLPDYVRKKDPKKWVIRNYMGKEFDYPTG